MTKETWHDRLRQAFIRSSFNDNMMALSRASGVPYPNLVKYFEKKIDKPRGDAIERLAVALEVDPIWLMTGVSRGMPEAGTGLIRDPARQGNILIPDLAIFGGMGNGGLIEIMTDEDGIPTDHEQVRGYWSFPDYMAAGFGNHRHIHAWEAKGDSMEPTIFGGSVVFVDTAQRALPPDEIYALDYGDGLMVKRLKLVPKSNKILVISDNERYGADEMLREEVNVFGRVIGLFQWRK